MTNKKYSTPRNYFCWSLTGGLAQMVERSLSMWEVRGSIPRTSKSFSSAALHPEAGCLQKDSASSGNRTRAARVAGEHSTTEPTMLALVVGECIDVMNTIVVSLCKNMSQSVGFEPTLPEGNWFLVSRLNHSATTACLLHWHTKQDLTKFAALYGVSGIRASTTTRVLWCNG